MVESVKSADRVLDVLTLLSKNMRGMTFTDICSELGWPKSSTHGLLATLQSRGFLDLNESDRRYSVGIRTWEVGQAYLGGQDLAQDALPYMQELCDDINETVQLAVLDGRENVYIGKVDAMQPLALASRVGIRLPAHVTGVGKVLLAGLAEPTLDGLFAGAEFVKYTPKTISSLARLKQALREVRANGFAQDGGEYTRGVYCIAVPILDEGGATVAAMSVSVPDVRLTDDLKERMLSGLLAKAAGVSGRLGYRADAGNRAADLPVDM